jgi:membrane-associated phospholipid phosphatase
MLDWFNQIDTELFLRVNNGMQNALLDAVCPWLREPKFWIPLYVLLLYLCVKQFGVKTIWVLLSVALLVLISDQFSANLVKNIFQRLRPCNQPALKAQVHLLVHCGSGYSFMSAHASNHFAIAVFLGLLLKQNYKYLIFALVVWAFSIAFSQVYVGVHYPFDVTCGAIAGSLWGYLMWILLNRYSNKLRS